MKIKEIKIVNQDQSTEVADIGADAINIDYNNTTVKAELDKLNNDNSINKNNITSLESGLNTTNSNLALQTSRIDNIASLDEGSTTGDAELIDARIDHKGHTYISLGNHIRDYENNMKNSLKTINSKILINPDNIAPDPFLKTAIALDESTTIIEENPSNIIQIQRTGNDLVGASVEIGNIFNPLATGTYYFHFKCRCLRNSAYAYQHASLYFYMYLDGTLKGSFTQILESPKANPDENDYIEYSKSITFTTGESSSWNELKIFAATKFDFYIKDFYILPYENNLDCYTYILSENEIQDLIDQHPIQPTKTNKKLSIVGDSLSAEADLAEVPNKYWYYLHENDGYVIDNHAVSGAGYFNGSNAGGTNNHQFYNQASLIPSNTDIILVFGGFNDAGKIVNGNVTLGNLGDTDTDTIYGCIYNTINNIRTTVPGAIIGIVNPTPWQGMNTMISSDNPYYEAVHGIIDAIKNSCEYYSVPLLDLWRTSNLRPWDSSFRTTYYKSNSDGTHPNSLGHYHYIYPHMREFLKSLNYDNI